MGFSKGETNGLLILIPILFAILSTPRIVKEILIRRPDPYAEIDQRMLNAWIAEINASIQSPDSVQAIPKLYAFDPNSATKDELLALGFKRKTANMIDKYRTSGGKFYKKEDLMKIYGISEEYVKQLWDYIEIKEQPVKKKKKKAYPSRKKYKSKSKKIISINLNTTTADSLTLIRGIGPVLSKRIIKFRDGLGGFVGVHQLEEVYGLDEDVLEKLTQIGIINNSNVKTVDLNAIDAAQLQKHPYISRSLAHAIIAFRKQHGPYVNSQDLLKIKIMNDSILQKIEPYLLLN